MVDWQEQKEYLMKRPLSIEILHCMNETGITTASEIAEKLKRSLSTITIPLKEMESIGILSSEKEGRNRYFQFTNPSIQDNIIIDADIRNAFMDLSSKLKSPSKLFDSHFEEKLFMKLRANAKINTHYLIKGFLTDTGLDFVLLKDNRKYGIELKTNINLSEPHIAHREIGKFIDIIKGNNDLNALIPIYLVREDDQNAIVDKYEFVRLLESLGGKIIIHPIIVNYDENRIDDDFYFEWLATEVQRKIEYIDLILREQEDITDTPNENTIFYENFDNYVLGTEPPTPWIVYKNGVGKAIITNDVNGASSSLHSLKLTTEINSNVYVRRSFNPISRFVIDYYIRQSRYNNSGVGSPFIIISPNRIERNNVNDRRAVYMEIVDRKLRDVFQETPVICEIEPNKWYHVVIDVDCVRHKYTCKIDDAITYEGLIDPRFKSINEIRTKHFANTQEWTTYLDEIRVKEIISG